MKSKASTLLIACALAAGVAAADESIVVVDPATVAVVEPALVVAPADVAAPIASAKLDAALVQESAALEGLGLDQEETTALLFLLISLFLYNTTTDGTGSGVQVPPTH